MTTSLIDQNFGIGLIGSRISAQECSKYTRQYSAVPCETVFSTKT